jgi:hypothetical protein
MPCGGNPSNSRHGAVAPGAVNHDVLAALAAQAGMTPDAFAAFQSQLVGMTARVPGAPPTPVITGPMGDETALVAPAPVPPMVAAAPDMVGAASARPEFTVAGREIEAAGPEAVYTPPSITPGPFPCYTIGQATVCFENPCNESAETLRFASTPLGGWEPGNPAFVSSDLHVCVQDKPRVILLFGYWPPTDIGIPSRRGMLWKWKDWQRNYNDSGFDVLAISPKFPSRVGWSDLAMTIPFWGKGEGKLRVDYQDTSSDFWGLVKENNPIAILSFSRGAADKSWEFEAFAKNRPRADWTTSLPYRDDTGALAPGSPMMWSPPAPGGTRGDKSPSKFMGPKLGDPPDPTEDAGYIRESNLPMARLKAILERRFAHKPANLVPRIDDDRLGLLGGTFVSEYMSYHVNWYRDNTQKEFPNDPNKQCWYAGHTHVGVFVDRFDAALAVEIQLDSVIERIKLEKRTGIRIRK